MRKIILIDPNTMGSPLDKVVNTTQLFTFCLVTEKPQIILSFPSTTTSGHRVVAFCTPLPMSLPSDPSVFDILNLFHHHWFLSRDWLVSNVASAQRTDGLSINWVEFPPTAHTHLVRCAIKLAPSIAAAKVKQVI